MDDSAESIPLNWIPLKIKGNTDEENFGPATFPQHETTPWFAIIVSILDKMSPPTVSTAAEYRARYSAAVDTVGGDILSKMLTMIANHGVVSCCGNVAGPKFSSSVFPFILRGIQLSGIDSAESSIELKKDLWELLSNEWSLDLSNQTKIVKISEIKEEIDKILKGEQIGRVVIQHGE